MQAKANQVASFESMGPETPAEGFYVGPALQQRLDLIEHLLEFGRQLILLSGDAGAGKSSVLTEVARATAERWRCISLHGGPALDGASLLAQVADALGQETASDEYPEGDPELLEKVRQRIGQVERSGKPVVLLLDDADHLPPDALGMLLALARTEDQSAEARVLMTAASEHSALIASLQRDRQLHGLVHVVEIPRIGEEETEDFLRQRLLAGEGALEDWFTPGVLNRITEEANGNPGTLYTLAMQAGGGRSAVRRETSASPWSRLTTGLTSGGGRTIWRWAPAALLPLALIGWLLLKPATPEPPQLLPEQVQSLSPAASGQPVTVPPVAATAPGDAPAPQRIEIALPAAPTGGEQTPAASASELPSPPTASASPATPTPVEPAVALAPEAAATVAAAAGTAVLAAGDTPLPAAGATATHANATKVSPPASTAQSAPPKPEKQPAKSAQKPAPKPVAKPAQSKPAQSKPAPAKPAPPTAASGGKATTGYALQLFGVSDRQAATGFIARHKLGDRARIIDSRREGKPWFVVAYGNYPTRSAARNAVARLPPAVRREVQPWVRDVKSLNALPR